ncbi:MAG: hypothetical protein ACKOED_04190 [Aestuariivirga sp.]|uniref:hypothetical protein n=1 Tax=Aestuariivirga sp. TaxID=2650926 RepID=UPI0038D02E3B
MIASLVETPCFTLVCPGYRSAVSHAGASVTAGRLALAIGPQLVAELDDGDLAESWAATAELSSAEAEEMSEAAALHLIEMLEDGLSAGDLSEAVVDAAVVFLLAMKRHGISDPRRIPACTVRWALHGEREKVMVAS